MTRLAAVMWMLSIAGATSSALAQASAPTPAPSLVFVYDGGGAHVSGDRLRRALAAGLHRPVLRLTDEQTDASGGRLTIVYSPPDRWVIDFVRGDAHTTRTVLLRSSTVARLTRVAINIITDTEPVPAPTRTGPAPGRGEWIALIGDEILDPFAGQTPTRSRRSIALVQELVDPFGGALSARHTYDDVIDPWSR